MHSSYRTRCTSVAVVLALTGLFCFSTSAIAKKGKGGGGNGGGGSDDDAAPSYTIVRLDNWSYFTGNQSTGAFDISELGHAVGSVYDPLAERSYAAFWEIEGNSSTLTPLTGAYTAYALNNLNQMVGWSGLETARGSVFWPAPDAEPIALPALTALYGYNYAWDINDAGVICGFSRDPEFDNEGNFVRYVDTAVVWRVIADGDITQISDPLALPAPEDSRAQAITGFDSAGDAYVVGAFAPVGTFPRGNAAVGWRISIQSDGSLTVAPDPVVYESGEAEAFAVNELALAAGQGKEGTAPPKGRVWIGDAGYTLADYPARKERGVNYRALDLHAAFGINDSGVIVGSADYANYTPDFEAVVWPSIADLPILLSNFLPNQDSPFARLNKAHAINSQGVIVGEGFVDNEFGRFGFLAIPQ